MKNNKKYNLDLEGKLPSLENVFYNRTYDCDGIMERMDGFKTQFINPFMTAEEDSNIRRLVIDDIIDKKLNSNFKASDYINSYIAKNYLILDNMNSVFLYNFFLIMDLKEYDNKKEKLLSSFCTYNVVVEEEDGIVYIATNCRNEAEVYIILKVMRDNNIKFNKLILTAYTNTRITTDIAGKVRGVLEEKDIVELLSQYNRKLLFTTLMVNSIDSLDEEEKLMKLLYRLAQSPVEYFIEKYNLNLSSIDFLSTSLALYQNGREYYTRYCRLFAYILLHIEDEKVKNFFTAISSSDLNPFEKARRVFRCNKELNFIRNEKDEYDDLLIPIREKVESLIENKGFDTLNCIMDIVDSTFIGYVSSPAFKDLKTILK